MPTYTPNEPTQSTRAVPPGIYEVEVIKATEKISQSGNEMISLVVGIRLPSGAAGPDVFDHLVFTPKATWKIDQFLAAVGIGVVPGEPISIEAGELIGKTGLAEIGQEPGSQNPDVVFNKINRWVFGDERKEWLRAQRAKGFAERMANPPAKASVLDDDEVPF